MLFSRFVVECTLVTLSLVLPVLPFVNANGEGPTEKPTKEPTEEPNPKEKTSFPVILPSPSSGIVILPSPSSGIFLNPISNKSPGLSLSSKVAMRILSDSHVAVLETGKTLVTTLSHDVLKYSSIGPNSGHSSATARASRTAQITSSPASDLSSSSVDVMKSHHLLTSILSSTVKSASLGVTEFHPSQTSMLSTQRQNEISSAAQKRSTSLWISSQALVQESISFGMSSKSVSKEGRVVSSSMALNLQSLPLKSSSNRGTPVVYSLSKITGHTAVGTLKALPTFTMSSIQSTVVYSIPFRVNSTGMTYPYASATFSSSSLLSRTTPNSTLYPQSTSTLLPFPLQPSSSVQSLPPATPPPPDPPILAETKAQSANIVYITWNVSSGQIVDNFTVELSLDSVTWKQATCEHSLLEEKCVVAQREAQISGLQPYTNYTFRVFAVNQFGFSKTSEESVWVITNEAEPSKPQNISTQSLNSEEIRVMWAEPLHPNGRIRYRLSYHLSSEPNSTAKVIFDGNATKFLVIDLKPFTRYTFIVVAYNVKHNYSSHAVVAMETTDPAEPSPPRNITAKSINSTAVKVTWLKALHPNGVIRYRLYVRLSKDEQSANRLVYDRVNTVFVVSQLQEFAEYTFTVKSFNVKYNWTSTPAFATEMTHPAEPTGPPQNVRALTLSSTSILVTWDPPLESEQNGVIIKYTVQYTLQASGETKNLNTTGNETSLEVKNLSMYTNYSFAVKAWNIIGIGPNNKPVVNTTLEGQPSPPRNITAKSVNSTAVKVTWLKALHPNGEIRYILYVRLSKDEQSANRLVSDGLNTVFVVSRLQEFAEYTFTVKSFNVKYNWTSTPAVATETTHPAEPTGPPQNVRALTLSSTSILVTWDPPLESEQNGVIIKYTVQYTLQASGETKNLNTTGNETSLEVKNLSMYTNYSFAVKAWNIIGIGPNNKPVVNTTLEGRPSPPTDMKAKSVNSTAVKVTWNVSIYPNGEIQYRLFYWQSSEGVGARIQAYDGRALECTVIGLHEYVEYYFMLVAYNVKLSFSSAAVNATETTHPAKPTGFPVNVTAVANSSTSILVKWSPPKELDRNGLITHYIVIYNMTQGREVSASSTGNITEMLIVNLAKFTEYYIRVLAVNSVGMGPASQAVIGRTLEDLPGAPNITDVEIRSSSLAITWRAPSEPNGILRAFSLCWSLEKLNKRSNVTLPSNNTVYNITKLKPYTRYNVSLSALTSIGSGPLFSRTYQTDEGVPSAPLNVRAWNTSESSIFVSWMEPAQINGVLLKYKVFYNGTESGAASDKDADVNTNTSLINLTPYTRYSISVQAFTRKGGGGKSGQFLVKTDESAPSGPPNNIKIKNTSSTSITLTWDPPSKPNGVIVGYRVKYYEEQDLHKKTVHVNVKEQLYTLPGLKPWSYYHLSVACESSGGMGQYSKWISQRTDEGEPPPIGTPALPEDREITTSTFEVVLPEASNVNGNVRYYQVIVKELAKDHTGRPVQPYEPNHLKTNDLHTYDQARRKKPTLVPYIAFQFNAADFYKYKNFTVGDGRESRGLTLSSLVRRSRRAVGPSVYYNGPLEEKTFYTVFLRAYVNKDAYTSSPWTDPVETSGTDHIPKRPSGDSSSTKVGLIVGLVITLLVVVILVLLGVFYIRRKRLDLFGAPLDDREDYSNGEPMKLKARRKRRSLQKRLMGSTDSLEGLEELSNSRARRQPVPIDDFERHVDRMHMDGDHGFSEEYALVQPEEEFSFQQFLNPANKYKNRYANIVAYDHTRVLLSTIEGMQGSDYINANFIDGYNRPRAYIAAQGPLMETFDDFWRMVWEQRSSVIVMLTKLEERGRKKCDKYWPDRGAKTYGQVHVTLKETLNMSYYTVRKMTISHKQIPDEERNIKQFHFTVWPDHGVPSHPTPLLSLVRHVSTSNRDAYGPMVVHCSAGVGRTGTFITLDVMLQKISEEDCVDVFGFVRQMRFQRNFMVQTEAQYVFIHDALLEAISCGVTEVQAKDLSTRLKELRQVDPETGYTYLENEFCRLAKEENHPIAFKSASLTCNAMKNRYANILPFESTRVHLKMRPGEMGSDYINANYIDGYCQPKAYIATQAPVPDTFEDFWRLIWEHESAAIVMLTMEEERGKVKCHRYWPSDGSRLYGVILVEMIEEETCSDYVTRKFKLTHTEEKDTRTIRQFQYTDWPDSGFPDYGVGIIDLIGQVQKWQQQSGNTAIVIHCSGGVGRTGVFCAVSIMIERLKAEGVIDVFQTVQAMRLQRPAMVQTADQYEFCYTTLQEYLDSFDLYANFQ